MAVGFGQIRVPTKIKVGYQNDNASVPAVKAFKDADTAGTGAFDTVIEAYVGGVAGNLINVAWIGDAGGAVTIDVLDAGLTVIIHYKAATSTVTNVESAITALSGANKVIDVKTGGTGATVLQAIDASSMTLSGGVDAVPVETYAQALAAIEAADPDFYGICGTSRTPANQKSLAQAVAAEEGTVRRMCFFQSADASLKTATPSGVK